MKIDPLSVGAALMDARRRLEKVSETPGLDAQSLLADTLQCSREWMLAHPDDVIDPQQREVFESHLQRVERGEPLPYVLGWWDFYNLRLIVTPAVLIPRPETELLVERGLEWLEANPGKGLAADVGSGSGCIAVSLAANCASVRVAALDISAEALRVTRANSARHNVAERVLPIQMDLLSGVTGTLDLVCANLPYIPTQTLHGLAVYGREPTLALDGGADGLDLIRRLLPQIACCLSQGGLALLEIESGQGLAAVALARAAFPSGDVRLRQDLASRDRWIEIIPG
jgi:release factor glutamine methyltransferase